MVDANRPARVPNSRSMPLLLPLPAFSHDVPAWMESALSGETTSLLRSMN
jgi:hypothetical protein